MQSIPVEVASSDALVIGISIISVSCCAAPDEVSLFSEFASEALGRHPVRVHYASKWIHLQTPIRDKNPERGMLA
jgi:hypothetical protein